jgi:hypothetical protein
MPYIGHNDNYRALQFAPDGAVANPNVTIKTLICPGRRTTSQAGHASDYGWYAHPDAKETKYLTASQRLPRGMGGDGVSLPQMVNRDGPENTLMLTHLGMNKTWYGQRHGQPEYWQIGTCERSDPQLYHDEDSQASDGRLGGPFSKASPSAFYNRTVRQVRYNASINWKGLWGWQDQEVIPASAYE